MHSLSVAYMCQNGSVESFEALYRNFISLVSACSPGIDMILANPPYIPSIDEASGRDMLLGYGDGGDDGEAITCQIFRLAR